MKFTANKLRGYIKVNIKATMDRLFGDILHAPCIYIGKDGFIFARFNCGHDNKIWAFKPINDCWKFYKFNVGRMIKPIDLVDQYRPDKQIKQSKIEVIEVMSPTTGIIIVG